MKLRFNHSVIHAIVFLLALTCGSSSIVFGQTVNDVYKNANQLYKANQFQKAAENYNKIISQGYKSIEVFYNLGNCYYKIDSIGKAVLFYERALRLAPNDEDIQHNIKLAYLKTIDKIQPVPRLAIIRWWNEFVSLARSKGWGIFSLTFIWLAVLLFAVSFFIGGRRVLRTVALLAFLLSITCLFIGIKQKHWEERSDEAILMVSTSFVKSAPDTNASDLFLIHEGVKLHILDEVGGWNKIRLDDGKVGWIEKGNFEKI